jgi:hypothetical protein
MCLIVYEWFALYPCRYRQGTRSSVARDATAYDKASGNAALTFDVSAAAWASSIHSSSSSSGSGSSSSSGPIDVHCSEHHVNGYQRSASIMSNGQSVLPYLNRPALKAAKMFSSGNLAHHIYFVLFMLFKTLVHMYLFI